MEQRLSKSTPEAAAALRELAVGKLRRSLSALQASFAATPDDKLDFKPSETANSPRELVAHVISGNQHVGSSLGVAMPAVGEAQDRASLVDQLDASTEAIIAAIAALPDEAMDGTISFFGMDMPTPLFLLVDEWHLSRHAGQLDYLQTIWGDMENRF